MNKLKEFLFKLGVGERKTLIKHEHILEEIDHATIISRHTIEEHIKLRGFPYSRLVHHGASNKGS